MKSYRNVAMVVVIAVATLVLGVLVPTMAQEDDPDPTVIPNYPLNTITVTGTGSVFGTPDLAHLFIGVEIFDSDLSAAFAESNNRIDTIINAVMEAGVAREDIRTTGLNVFIDRSGPPMPVDAASSSAEGEPSGQPQTYVVSNQIRLTIRDINQVADVINAAVEAGANNIFGLEFAIDNRDELEGEARNEAMADARDRAEQLAQIAGVSLGEVVVITEGGGGFSPFGFDAAMSQAGLGGGGAVIEPGQLSVSMQVQVTYAISR